MKRKTYRIPLGVILIAATCLAIVPLQGCQTRADAQGAPAAKEKEPETIALLLPSDEASTQDEFDGTFTAWLGTWDVTTGDFSLGKDPTVTMTGENRQDNTLSWDGKNQYLVWDETVVTAHDKDAAVLPCRPAFQNDSRMIWGSGYQVELTQDAQCVLTQEEKNAITIPLSDPKLSVDGKAVALKDLSVLGCTKNNEQLTLVYAYLNENQNGNCVLLHAKLDLKTKEVTWSEPVTIPDEYRDGFFFCDFLYHPIIDQKLYFSSWDSIAYYDLKDNQFVDMKEIPKQVKTLLPQAERATFEGKTLSAEVVGCTPEMVIGSISYQEPKTETLHEVYFAVKGDQVLGFLVWQDSDSASSITVYDKDLQQTAQMDTPNINLAPRFQMTVSPLPF